MFIGLLSACTMRNFDKSLISYSKEPIKCVSLNNRLCQARPTLVDINSNKTLFIIFILISVVEVLTLLMIHMLEFV